jgi:hypothetical protein
VVRTVLVAVKTFPGPEQDSKRPVGTLSPLILTVNWSASGLQTRQSPAGPVGLSVGQFEWHTANETGLIISRR